MNIIIWGAGQYGERVINYINRINESHKLFEIECVIDSSPIKTGDFFHGSIIRDVTYIEDSETDIVIAVKYDNEIKEFLNSTYKGKYYTFYEFVIIKQPLLDMVKTIDSIAGVGLKNEIKDVYNFLSLKNKNYKEKREILGPVRTLSCASQVYYEDLFKADNEIELDKAIESRCRNKIAFYYTKISNGGVQRVLSQLLKKLIDFSYELVMICSQKDKEIDEYELPKSVKKYYITDFEESPYESMMSLAKILIDEKIDLFCDNRGPETKNYYYCQLAHLLNIKYCVELHNNNRLFKGNEKVNQLRLRYVDNVITLSDDDKNYWSNLLSCECLFIPNQVEVHNDYKVRESNTGIIIWVGRIENSIKKVVDSIEVIRLVVTSGIDIRLKIIGTGDEGILGEIQNKILQYGLENYVELCGFHEDVSQYYKEADAILVTSKVESFSMVMAEGMSYGVPVVMYELPYLEIVKENKGIISVKQGNVEALAQSIIDIEKNPLYRYQLSLNAKEGIEKFSNNDSLNKWIEIFSS